MRLLADLWLHVVALRGPGDHSLHVVAALNVVRHLLGVGDTLQYIEWYQIVWQHVRQQETAESPTCFQAGATIMKVGS